MVDLIKDVLPVTIFYAEQAGNIIRSVYLSGQHTSIYDKEVNKAGETSSKNVSEMQAVDVLTIADGLAQSCIVKGLTQAFPGINIVAEEEPSEISQPLIPFTPDESLMEVIRGICPEKFDDSSDFRYNIDRLKIFIDPVDGTKEYASNRVMSSTVLIGVCVDGVPVLGIVHEPFRLKNTVWTQETTDQALLVDPSCVFHTTFGVVKFGHNLNAIRLPAPSDSLTCLSSFETPTCREILANFYTKVHETTHLQVTKISMGGFGSKCLRLLEGYRGARLLVSYHGLSPWDTCACEALFSCVDAAARQLSGEPLFDYLKVTRCGPLACAVTRDLLDPIIPTSAR